MASRDTSASPTVNDIQARAQYQALSSFTVFSKLPLELRLIIWNHALPKAPWFRVEARATLTDPAFEISVDLVYYGKKNEKDSDEYMDPLDIGLLVTCKESRQVYLEIFKHKLPMLLDGNGDTYQSSPILYFSDGSIIYIENFEGVFLSDSNVCHALASGYRVPKWFSMIKHLAIWQSWTYSEYAELYLDGFLQILSFFPRLKTVVGVKLTDYSWHLNPQDCVGALQLSAEAYYASSGKGFQTPRFELVALIPITNAPLSIAAGTDARLADGSDNGGERSSS